MAGLLRELVLVGGGHAHVRVMVEFARRPVAGVRPTLVTRDLETPYSGMLPGVIAGHYPREKAHVDLAALASATGFRLVHAEASGLDRARKRLSLANGAELAYDLLSLDVGISPDLDHIRGASRHGIPVKPVGALLERLDALMARTVRDIAVVGGGAGGVELILSLRHRLRDEPIGLSLVAGSTLLPTHNGCVRRSFRRILAARDVALLEGADAVAIDAGGVDLQDGRRVAADAVLVATGARAPRWFAQTGLELDGAGFLAVGATLQSTNDPDVFAAGDCAALIHSPREKAGVHAVRAGPWLAANLRARAEGRPLRRWRPQRRHLALISTGDRYAVASRGRLKLEGAWLWRLKDTIDRRWMRAYRDDV